MKVIKLSDYDSKFTDEPVKAERFRKRLYQIYSKHKVMDKISVIGEIYFIVKE